MEGPIGQRLIRKVNDKTGIVKWSPWSLILFEFLFKRGGEEEGEEEVNNGPPLRFLAANLFRVQGTVARCLLDLVIEKKVCCIPEGTLSSS